MLRIVFQTLSIAPPLIQQLQPRYMEQRGLFRVREGRSKMYSWVAFVVAAMIVEVPYSVIAGTIVRIIWAALLAKADGSSTVLSLLVLWTRLSDQSLVRRSYSSIGVFFEIAKDAVPAPPSSSIFTCFCWKHSTSRLALPWLPCLQTSCRHHS